MHTQLPEPWIIAEVERQRRNEWERDERPALELPLPPPPPPRDDGRDTGNGRGVIVIELW